MAQQVVRREVSAKLVVVAHAVAAHAIKKAVDHHERHRQLRKVIDELSVGGELVRDHEEDPVDTAVHQQPHQLDIALGGSDRVCDQQQVALLAAENLEAVGERGKVSALDVGHDKPKRMRLLHDQAAGNLVGNVVLTLRDLLDATAVLLAHATRSVVEDERDRGG